MGSKTKGNFKMNSETKFDEASLPHSTPLDAYLDQSDAAYLNLDVDQLDELERIGIDTIRAQMLEELSSIAAAQERLKQLQFLEAKLAAHLVHVEKARRQKQFPSSEEHKYGYIEGSARWHNSAVELNMAFRVPVPSKHGDLKSWTVIRHRIPRNKSGWGVRALSKRKASPEEIKIMLSLADIYNALYEENLYSIDIKRAQKKISDRITKRFGNSPDFLEGYL